MAWFKRASPEERFWQWFEQNSGRLYAFEADRDRVFGELKTALSKVQPGLTFEFGPVRDGRREFIVSADGIRDRFPAVQNLVAAAPVLAQWIVIPFRPPKSLDMVIEYDGQRVGLLDSALGEFAVETRVGFIEWQGLPDNPAAGGLQPFPSIRDVFDIVVH